MNKWHKVEEELPEDLEYVLVTDGEDYAVGSYRDDAHAWEHWCYGWLERDRDDECPTRLGKVTHWRRFPKLGEQNE